MSLQRRPRWRMGANATDQTQEFALKGEGNMKSNCRSVRDSIAVPFTPRNRSITSTRSSRNPSFVRSSGQSRVVSNAPSLRSSRRASNEELSSKRNRIVSVFGARKINVEVPKLSTHDDGTVELPGMDPIPVSITTIKDDEEIRMKVATHYAEFLECMSDIFRVLFDIKVRYLLSEKPMPRSCIYEIINNVKNNTNNTTMLSDFETDLPQIELPKNVSFEDFSKLCKSQHNISSFTPSKQNKIVKQNFRGVNRTNFKDNDSRASRKVSKSASKAVEIAIKKKPIWLKVACEKQQTILDVITANTHRHSNAFLIKSKDGMYGLDRPRSSSDKALDAPRHLTLTMPKLVPRHKDSNFKLAFATSRRPGQRAVPLTQRNEMAATVAGYSSRAAQDFAVNNNWYQELARAAQRASVYQEAAVQRALAGLARYRHADHDTPAFSRAKLCLLVQSLAVWDVTRRPQQRAISWIMAKIFLLATPFKDMEAWLAVRRLPHFPLQPHEYTFPTLPAMPPPPDCT